MPTITCTYMSTHFIITLTLLFIACFFSSVDETESHRGSKLKRSTGLPPVTPNACVKDTVKSLLFDQIWSEVITILHPLLVRIKQNASQGEK